MKYSKAGIILDMGSVNERRRYSLTLSLTSCAHTQNYPYESYDLWFMFKKELFSPLQLSWQLPKEDCIQGEESF